MGNVEVTYENTAITKRITSDAWDFSLKYRFHILVTQDEEGSYSAIVLNLPGTGSCGDTIEEALENVREAIKGVLETYKESGEEIPWKDSASIEIPRGAKQQWILVDA